MRQKEKGQSSVKPSVPQRFVESRSRRIYPAFPNTTFVFGGDWGRASTSMKLRIPRKRKSAVFAKCIYTCIACYF